MTGVVAYRSIVELQTNVFTVNVSSTSIIRRSVHGIIVIILTVETIGPNRRRIVDDNGGSREVRLRWT